LAGGVSCAAEKLNVNSEAELAVAPRKLIAVQKTEEGRKEGTERGRLLRETLFSWTDRKKK
jgi:hypothetical protein